MHMYITNKCDTIILQAALAEKLPPAPVKRIMMMNAPEWHYILIGCISALFTGAVHPVFSILFSEILGVSRF